MKTALFFLFTCFVVVGALYGALYAKHPLVLYGVAAGMIFLFSRYIARRNRRDAARRNMEQHFQEYMRYQMGKSRSSK